VTKLLPVLLLAVFALPSIAVAPKDAGPQKMTVAQLEQALAAAQDMPDAEAAQHLAGMELTERLSAAKLARWQAALPGEKARQALLLLADQSAFLDPPAEEIPDNPAPAAAALRQMMTLLVD
jgi:predicted house-cleaning NTP pyrophosphatase (Maf/HAM1 superfamily)